MSSTVRRAVVTFTRHSICWCSWNNRRFPLKAR